jgi:hypothetical protein
LEFVRTRVTRRRRDVLAAAQDSDQDEEEAWYLNNKPKAGEGDNFTKAAKESIRAQSSMPKKRVFYYYSLVFDFKFEHDYDTVQFAFSQPYTHTQILKDIFERE